MKKDALVRAWEAFKKAGIACDQAQQAYYLALEAYYLEHRRAFEQEQEAHYKQ